MRTGRLPALLVFAALAVPATASGQSARAPAWNGERALELVDRGRTVRQSQGVDSTLFAYEARADGWVYFFLDRPEADERTLVKTDQIALELFWEAPRRTGQRIVGLRDEKSLPTNINYHIDHLTVVQDDFGDRIRLGDGDEVGAVVHPFAPGAGTTYDYALGDSITIQYGGDQEVRVYEILVRPRDDTGPGFIGSVFIDRASASIVRMNFTFTPASYVDPYLDYIRISIDNSLWLGRHWLPYRQEVEIRRELPVLDFLAGSIIRGRWSIQDYEFNGDVERDRFPGSRIVAVPEAQRRAYPFERPLYDDLDRSGLAPSPNLEQIRDQARNIVTDRVLSGLSPVRLHAASSSDILRHNRAEGTFLGAGLALRPRGDLLLHLRGGWAFGRGAASGVAALEAGAGPVTPRIELYWDRLADMAPVLAKPGMTASLASRLGFSDARDPYFVRGGRLGLEQAGSSARIGLRLEEHRSGRDRISDEPGEDRRDVRRIHEGVLGAIDLTLPFGVPGDGRGDADISLARLENRSWLSSQVGVEWEGEDRAQGWSWAMSVHGGWVTGRPAAQSLFTFGGRGTLPGYPMRGFEGDRFGVAAAEVTIPIAAPWIGLRLLGAAGVSRLGSTELPEGWSSTDTGGVRPSLGAGLAVGWDVLRLDLVRGLRGGSWEFVFSVSPGLRDWL